MKVSELMIGDWVLKDNKPRRITRILDYGRISVNNPYGQYEADCGCEDVTPIPVTEEILKVNGFEDCGNRYDVKVSVLGKEDSHDTFSIAKGWENPNILYFRVSMMFPRLQYVHELQHAFRLCVLNDLADNFKIEQQDNESK